MALTAVGFDQPRFMSVPVVGNIFWIMTGVVIVDFRGAGPEWIEDTLRFELSHHRFAQSRFNGATAAASLCSIANDGHAVNAGWTVTSARARRNSNGMIEVLMTLQVRDVDGWLHRVGYEVNVLEKAPRR